MTEEDFLYLDVCMSWLIYSFEPRPSFCCRMKTFFRLIILTLGGVDGANEGSADDTVDTPDLYEYGEIEEELSKI